MDPPARLDLQHAIKKVSVYRNFDRSKGRGDNSATKRRGRYAAEHRLIATRRREQVIMADEWLRRSAAPLSAKTWKAIDETAVSMAKQTLVARRIADLD